MTEIRKASRAVAWGIMDVVVYFLVAMFLVNLALNYFNYGVDPTDKDGFNRSGLKYYKDYGTGIEYIGAGECLIKRELND